MPDMTRREVFTLNATLDVMCGACKGTPVELSVQFPVQLRLRAGRLEGVPLESEGDLPTTIRCLCCGATVRYGHVGVLHADQDGERIPAAG